MTGVAVSDLAELRAFVDASTWTFAKTMAHIPHWYTVRRDAASDAQFEWFVMFIREHGYRERWGPYFHHYLDLDGWKYWTMGAELAVTVIINRTRLVE